MADPTGIDVSYAQGLFNWAAEKGKINFGACKVTEGLTITDPDWVHNWDAMWSMNSTHTFPRFGYHFFHASDNGVEQADRFYNTVKSRLLSGDNLILDLEATESNGTNDGVAPATTAARARQFLETLDRLAPGHRVLVYTSPSFAAAGNCAGMNSWALWVANYGVSKPAVPRPWSNWTFWQTGETPLDTDRFNGTESQLLSWVRMPASR